MKKISLTYPFCFLILVSCGNPELEKQEAKLKEINCKTEWLVDWQNNSTNITTLGLQKGFKEELENFNKLINDSTVTCDSLKYKWNELSDKISE